MHLPLVVTLFDEATTVSASTALKDDNWRDLGHQAVTYEVSGTHTGLDIVLEESLDGITWYGTDHQTIDSNGRGFSQVSMPYFRARITSISSGNVTLKIC